MKMFLQDPLTGDIEQTMKTPYKKAHRLGGTQRVSEGSQSVIERDLKENLLPPIPFKMSGIRNEAIDVLWDEHLQWPQKGGQGDLRSIDVFHVRKSIRLTFDRNSLHFSSASTKSEMCDVPRKLFTELDSPPVAVLTALMYESCLNSSHPSVYICKHQPETKKAKTRHRRVKRQLRLIQKRKKRRKKRREKRSTGRRRLKKIMKVKDRRKTKIIQTKMKVKRKKCSKCLHKKRSRSGKRIKRKHLEPL